MTGRPHLTPSTIVDRRGRTTTVYRGPGDGARTPRPLNAIPSVPVPAPASAQQALHAPAPLSAEEVRRAASLARNAAPSVPLLRETLVDEPEGRAALALAAEVAAAGTLTDDEARQVLGYAVGEGGHGRAGAALALDFIRVAERMALRSPARGRFWPSDFSEAMMGARWGHSGPLRTVGELDSTAAVAAFILWDEEHEHTRRVSTRHYFGRPLNSAELAELLYERPADLDRIIGYAAERKMASESPGAVTALREWLVTTGDTSAVGGGWL